MAKNNKPFQGTTIGVDVGDRSSSLCVLDPDGEIVEESKIPSTLKAFEARFLNREPVRVVLETGTHANWMHDALEAMGHEVLVADSRELRTISESDPAAGEHGSLQAALAVGNLPLANPGRLHRALAARWSHHAPDA